MTKARIVTSRFFVCDTAHLFTVGTVNGPSPHDAPYLPILTHHVNKKMHVFWRFIQKLFTTSNSGQKHEFQISLPDNLQLAT